MQPKFCPNSELVGSEIMRFCCGLLRVAAVPPWCSLVWFSAHSACIPATQIRHSREQYIPYTSQGHSSSFRELYAQIHVGFYFFLWNYMNIFGKGQANYSVEYKISSLKTRAPISPLYKSLVFLFLKLSSVKLKFCETFAEHWLCTRHWGMKNNQRNPFLHRTHDLAAE